MKKKLIFIGGVPGVGKTTIAYHLALKLKIEHILNIDVIKAFTRTYKDCFNDEYVFTTTHEAFKIEGIKVVDGFLKHSLAINKILLNVLDNMKDKIVIIEGATINGDFINSLDKNKYDIVYINLFVNRDELIDRYSRRLKIREGKWLDNLDNILEINDYLKENSFNIENKNIDRTIDRIVDYVKEILCI